MKIVQINNQNCDRIQFLKYRKEKRILTVKNYTKRNQGRKLLRKNRSNSELTQISKAVTVIELEVKAKIVTNRTELDHSGVKIN